MNKRIFARISYWSMHCVFTFSRSRRRCDQSYFEHLLSFVLKVSLAYVRCLCEIYSFTKCQPNVTLYSITDSVVSHTIQYNIKLVTRHM